MPTFETEIHVNATPEAVLDTVLDFPGYREIVPNIREAEIEASEGDASTVRFALELPVRRVTYRLRYVRSGDRVSWSMVESNTLTANEGEWTVEGEEGGARVRYRHAVQFPMWMAWAVTDAAFAREMDKTLQAFKTHMEEKGGA